MNNNRFIKREIHVEGLQLREQGDNPNLRTIEGTAIVFNSPSATLWETEKVRVREVISPSAITREFLDQCNIVLTMFHDNTLVLGRSKNGKGTLAYNVSATGVSFVCDIDVTTDVGKRAISMIERGDIDGCSFAFSADYWDPQYVLKNEVKVGEKVERTYTVIKMDAVYDMTITPNPAYPATACNTRDLEMLRSLCELETEKESHEDEKANEELERAYQERMLKSKPFWE